ncbi:sialidase family protein [soil metagenome]
MTKAIRLAARGGALLAVACLSAACRPAPAPVTPASAAADTGIHRRQDLAVANNGAPVYRIPALAVTTAGTLVAAYDARPAMADLPSHIAVVIRRSTDNGLRWLPQRVVREEPAPKGYGDPSLLVDRTTGRIFLFLAASQNRGFVNSATGSDENNPNILQADVSYSDDDGITWQHRRITSQIKDPAWGGLFATSGAGIQIVHGQYAGRLVQQYVVRYQLGNWAASAYSDDHGQTWHMGHLVGPGLDENKSVELSNGTLMLNSRATPYRKVAYSNDGGVTWTGLHDDTQLHDPNDNGSIIRFDGDAPPTTARARWLLFSNNESTSGRQRLVIKMSCDDGKIWPIRNIIEPGFAAYSTLARLPDGTFGVLWESDEYKRITFSTFDERWLGRSCE